MLLYIRNDERCRIDKIELIDGCCPRIKYDVAKITNEQVPSTSPNDEYYVSTMNIEPAVWGIILLLDCVYVDVTQQKFSWSTKSVGKVKDVVIDNKDDSFHEKCYNHDACYEYDDNIDELFNLAEYLIEISRTRSKRHRKSKEEQLYLVRMLYCCILPKIQINCDDQSKVEAAIRNEKLFIKKLNEQIENESQALQELQDALCQQQDERLKEFEELALDKKCTKNFVLTLKEDLNKRKNHLREKIELNQLDVQAIKADIEKNGETDEKKLTLSNARKMTEQLREKLHNILVATADSIEESLMEDGFQSQDNVPIVLKYLHFKEMTNGQKIITQGKMEKKVHATSILENLKRIKEEIGSWDGRAIATLQNSSEITDVLRDKDIHIPEYQTLSERVVTIVNNPEHPFGAEFATFTKSVRRKCRDIASITPTHRHVDHRDYLVINGDCTMDEYMIPLERLCLEIKEHFDRMSMLLLDHFNRNSQDVLKRNKLQLYYEKRFYDEVGKDIVHVYEVAHETRQKKMIRDLERLSTYPINCLHLAMKDEWWHKLFEKRRQVNVAKQRSNRSMQSCSDNSSSSSSGSCSPPDNNDISLTPSSRRSSAASTKDPDGTRRSPARRRGINSLSRFLRRLRRHSEEIIDGENKQNENTNSHIRYDDYSSYRNLDDDRIEDNTNFTNGDGDSINYNGNDCRERGANNAIHDVNGECSKEDFELSTFEKHFGPSMYCLKELFLVSSVFEKLNCLTKSLTMATNAVYNLRQQVLEKVDDEKELSLAITADDLLPLMVLIILQMDASDAAAIVTHLEMMQDLSPRFLTLGCHGYALVEFEMASKVLESLCSEFDWSDSFSPRN